MCTEVGVGTRVSAFSGGGGSPGVSGTGVVLRVSLARASKLMPSASGYDLK